MVGAVLDWLVAASDCDRAVVALLVWEVVGAGSSVGVEPIVERLVLEMSGLLVETIETFLVRRVVAFSSGDFLDEFLLLDRLAVRTVSLTGVTAARFGVSLGATNRVLLLVQTIETLLVLPMITLPLNPLLFTLLNKNPKTILKSRKLLQLHLIRENLKIDSIDRNGNLSLSDSLPNSPH